MLLGWDLFNVIDLFIKEFGEIYEVRENGAGGVGRLINDEKMLWSLQGSCAEISSFSL